MDPTTLDGGWGVLRRIMRRVDNTLNNVKVKRGNIQV